MAYQPNELFATTAGNVVYRVQPEYVQAKTIAALGGAPVLPVLTPMAKSTATGKLIPWSDDANGVGQDVINCFIWPGNLQATPGVQTDAVNDTLANVLMRGVIHHDDIPVPTGETQADLDVALATVELRQNGFMIQGLVASG